VVRLEPTRFEIQANLAFALRGPSGSRRPPTISGGPWPSIPTCRTCGRLGRGVPDPGPGRPGHAGLSGCAGQEERRSGGYAQAGQHRRPRQRLDEAQKYYTKALKLNPARTGIYNDLGIIERFKGRYSEAKRLLEKAIELDSKFLPAYSNLAIVLQNMASSGWPPTPTARPCRPTPTWARCTATSCWACTTSGTWTP